MESLYMNKLVSFSSGIDSLQTPSTYFSFDARSSFSILDIVQQLLSVLTLNSSNVRTLEKHFQ